MKRIETFPYNLRMDSPIGTLWLASDGNAITRLEFENPSVGETACPVLERAAEELEEYFAGKRAAFDVPLLPMGTDFQRRVWAALREIPYGTTVSYQSIAQAVGIPNASRAIGMANHANPISILIPCHRVIGKNGSLTGYGGGLERKRFLLRLEANRVEI